MTKRLTEFSFLLILGSLATGLGLSRGLRAETAPPKAVCDLTREDNLKLFAADGTGDEEFGAAVSLDGDLLLVGAPTASVSGHGGTPGAAYLYRRNGSQWAEEEKLVAGDGFSLDFFGNSVSVSGDVAIVGAPGDDDRGTNSGSAYVFRHSGGQWQLEKKLLAGDASKYASFGNSVLISGNVAVVGAPSDSSRGAAYVFRWDGLHWLQEAKLVASDAASGDGMGTAVSISADTVLVGSPWDDDRGPNSGSAYVFRWDGVVWGQEAKLLPDSFPKDDGFGFSVSISGDAAIVGAYGDDDQGVNSGAAYVFRRNAGYWAKESKLKACGGVADDQFGWSVAIEGDFAVVGAPQSSKRGIYAGAAYRFRRNGNAWVQEPRLQASDANERDFLGWSVAISEGEAVVGAEYAEGLFPYSGVVYLFR